MTSTNSPAISMPPANRIWGKAARERKDGIRQGDAIAGGNPRCCRPALAAISASATGLPGKASC